MSAQKASAPVRFARLAAAAVMVALAALLVIRLAGRRDAPPAAPAAPPPEGQVVDLKEKVRHQEYRDGRAVADVRGRSFFRGPDGRNHLTGAVEVLSLDSAGETVSRLTADEVAYDPGALRFAISGHVRVEAGGVVLEGEAFDYDKPAGRFETKAGGRFSSETMRGSAPGVSFSERADEIRLEGGFLAEIFSAKRTGEALSVSGDSLVYARRARRGRVDGRADLKGGLCRGTSASISFVATPDEGAFESAVFEGAAEVVFGGSGSPDEAGGEIRADRIAVAFSREPFALSTLEAGGGVVMSARAPDGRKTEVGAPAATLKLSPEGELTAWAASGGLTASRDDGAGFRLEADTAAFDKADGIVRAQGRPGRPAVASSEEALIEAEAISAGPGSRDLAASGRVECLLRSGDRMRSPGFFSSAEDVAVSCGSLVAREGAPSFVFSKEVRARQGADILRAGELELTPVSGDMSGRGGVSAELSQAVPGEAGKRKVEIGGQDMAYRPDLRTLTLSSKAYVRLPEARLEAGTISAVIGREDKALESLEAKTAVAVSKGSYKGRSDAASYRAAARRITLTGKPVLTDEKGGSARGAKLTFDLADDKILIENEGTGRATTVVRS
jgi:lipopolysaccharide export system protein LptA